MKKLIKYLPDILILAGVFLLSYGLFKPPSGIDIGIDLTSHHTTEKVMGVMLIAIGVNIAIRKYYGK